jgi:hypothetical protein
MSEMNLEQLVRRSCLILHPVGAAFSGGSEIKVDEQFAMFDVKSSLCDPFSSHSG